MRNLLFACFLLTAASAGAAEAKSQVYPLWDGKETIIEYAKHAGLEPTKTLDLGDGVTLGLVLIPAGKFTMGTPPPVLVDDDGFRRQIIKGQCIFALGAGTLLVMLAAAIIHAIRQRRRPQVSLGRFMVMVVIVSMAVLGAMHWWHTVRAFALAQVEFKAAQVRFENSFFNEKPAHEVTLTRPFYMGKYSVTQAQYQQIIGTNPSSFKGPNLPVEQVSWNDATAFCQKSGEKTRQSLRMPTNAEREYACRAGTTTAFYTGDSEADLDKAGWYEVNSKNTTHPVGQKLPNAWGVYDMHGNLWEWCLDGDEIYKADAAVDPRGPLEGQYRVIRGGAFNRKAQDCRTTGNRVFAPGTRGSYLGFRVVVPVVP